MNNADFDFVGEAPLSKSLLIRALIIKSWFSEFHIRGSSKCQDVQTVQAALNDFPNSSTYHCGLSGAGLRFLALRLARQAGEYILTGKKALLKRPFHELPVLLGQLSVSAKPYEAGWRIVSKGWIPQGDCIHVPSGITSQYASALILNGWQLDRDLYFSLNRNCVSFPYFNMTLNLVRQLGMTVEGKDREYRILKNQTLKVFSFKPEQDKSCLFALAALAALKGQCVFKPWQNSRLQPCSIFPEILRLLGVAVEPCPDTLKVTCSLPFKPLCFDVSSYPDLFPVLAVLCSRAEGISQLSGIRHQAFKESHRLNKTKELLTGAGIKTQQTEDSLLIFGHNKWPLVRDFEFDCSEDHRMVMAAALMNKSGVPVQLIGKEAVNKSFPDFLRYIGGI